MSRSRPPRPKSLPLPSRRSTWRPILLWFGAGLALSLAVGLVRASVLEKRPIAPAAPQAGGGQARPPARRSPAFERRVAAAFALLSDERENEAFEEFVRALRLAPDDPRPYLGLADVYRKLQALNEAEASYRKAIALDGTCWPAKLALAGILRDRGLHDEALALLREMEREDPRPFVEAEIGLTFLRRGSLREALPFLERYAAAEPGQPWGHAHLGRALAGIGERKKAEERFRRALALDPANGLARLWLGEILAEDGREEEGEAQLRAYHELRMAMTEAGVLGSRLNRDPRDVAALAGLAKIRFRMGKRQAAMVPLRRALALAPGDPALLELREAITRALEEGRP